MKIRIIIVTAFLLLASPVSYISAQELIEKSAPVYAGETKDAMDEYSSGAYDNDKDGMIDMICTKVEKDDL
ncbi:MAG: hypothetical protein Q7S30_01425 [Candidatus Omnitrophota bacterium]|nr:hypothetical protein [Candidatus Omnitrophota bacterium]